MTEKWHKAGARITGREQVERKVDGRLHAWDFLPIGEKIKKLEEFAAAAKGTPGGEFRFLSLVPRGELGKIAGRVEERLADERRNLEDMKRVFTWWNVDLGKLKLKPEQISYPHGTKWWYHEGHDLLMFTSPAMARWFEENVRGKKLQPSQAAPDEELVRAINRKNVFALGRVHTSFKQGVADIKLVQPIMFYKSLGGGLGKPGTGRRVPLENPELLLLYAQLVEAHKLGASKAVVHRAVPDYLEESSPIYKIYERIGKTSRRFRPETEGKTVSAVFKRRKGA